MCLKVQSISEIPEMTAGVAHAAFPEGSLYMKIRDQLGSVYTDEQFLDLFPVQGQPAEAPWRLALITIMQFAEDLTDRQAADAVRSRIDWKYALGLHLDDPGFHYSVLSKFRTRLVCGGAEEILFERMLCKLKEARLLKGKGIQRTDSTHILASIRRLNRLELVGEALRQALDVLTIIVPQWLRRFANEEWLERYGHPISEYRLPRKKEDREALALLLGSDGHLLLRAIYNEQPWLHAVPAVDVLRRIWVQQYSIEQGSLHWRKEDQTPPASIRLSSPFDLEARYGQKQQTSWFGYKVHLTETCEPDLPRLITHVETTAANEQDADAVESVHQSLDEHDLCPAQHLVDSAYTHSDLLVASRKDFGIELIGPVLPDTSPQALAKEGFDISRFQIDWQSQTITCPQGSSTKDWREGLDRHGKTVIHVRFGKKTCSPFRSREQCTRSKTSGRVMCLRPMKEHLALQEARERQQTTAFKEQYALRSGVEGLISQAVYALGMRRTRYRGKTKAHLQHVATATAINLKRAYSWIEGDPLSKTRTSRFASLAA